MRSWIIGGAIVVLAAQLAACGSALSTMKIQKAQQRIETQDFEGASSYSIYEATLAQSYLEQARRDWAHSDWQHAQRYAEDAKMWADRAVERAAHHGPATGLSKGAPQSSRSNEGGTE